MEDIRQLREAIDALDCEIIELLNRRCDIVRRIGKWKKMHSRPAYVPEREQQLLEKIAARNPGPLGNDSLVAIYREIISAAIRLECPLHVGCTASSHRAARERFGHGAVLREFPGFSELCRAIEEKKTDCAVVCFSAADLTEHLTGNGLRIIAGFSLQQERFLVLGMQETEPSGNDQTSLCFEPSCALPEIQNLFVRHKIVPVIQELPGNRFFADIPGHASGTPLRAMLDELRSRCVFFRLLGSYPDMK